MKTKLLGLFAIIAISFGLASCGSSNNPQQNTAPGAGVSQSNLNGYGYGNWAYGTTYNGAATSGYYYAPVATSYGSGWYYNTPSGNAACPYGYTAVPGNAYYCQMAAGTQISCPSGWTNTGTGCVVQQNYTTSCSGPTWFQLCTYANSGPQCYYNGYGLVCR